jgi:alpha-tubulin suppressor-like RCC1 family protein
MPTFYNFRQDGIDYSFDDIFVPADWFREGNLWVTGSNLRQQLGINNTDQNINISTPVTTFAGGNNWKQVEVSFLAAAAIKTDGTLWTWGQGDSGRNGTNDTINRPTPVTTFAGGTNWKQVAVGTAHRAAIKTDGTLWVWGSNAFGQLGTNDTTQRNTPVTTFAGGTNWKQVSGGARHTAVIKTDGTLWTWGYNTSGQLGTNDTTQRNTPVTTFAGGTNWKQVSSGGYHTAAIKTDGTLWIWGRNNNGQLGTNDTTQRNTPVTTFAGGNNWKQVSCSRPNTAAIKTDGTLWTWGSGISEQLARFGFFLQILTPVTTFAGGNNWADTPTSDPEDLYTISGGQSHSAAIKTDGTLWIWGSGIYGQLGTNDLTDRSTPVTTFAGGSTWKSISCARSFNTAIKTDGTLWTWGRNNNGQLGTNDLTNRSTPVTTFAGGNNWKQVSCGKFHPTNTSVLAIKTDGTLWTWGNNIEGQLGTNDSSARSTPVTTFAGGTNWKQCSSGNNHCTAIKTDGTLWIWGIGTLGRLGNGITSGAVRTPVTTFAGGTNWKQVISGGYHTAAIKTDGTLWTWGNNFQGQLGINDTTIRSTPVTTFAGGTNWKQVSGGNYHTTAIKTDGTLWTWGLNSTGQLGTNDTTQRNTPVTTFVGGTNWKQVSGGGQHTVVLRDDGANKELFLFGLNTDSQLGVPSNINLTYIPGQEYTNSTNWKQVSSNFGGVSNNNMAAIKTDGTLWTWGNNTNGQLGTNDTTQRNTPVTTFAGGTNWKKVSSGGYNIMAIEYIDPVI